MTTTPVDDRHRGGRTVGHTADVIVQAWGPTRAACLEEAALALVRSFAAVHDAGILQRVPFSRATSGDADRLLAVLEEAVFTVDCYGRIPVTVHVESRGPRDRVTGWFETAGLAGIEITGAVPKGVSRSGLALDRHDGRWSARALVDA